jgi:hypothetical protein
MTAGTTGKPPPADVSYRKLSANESESMEMTMFPSLLSNSEYLCGTGPEDDYFV